jgi:hypothetical protein
MVREEQDSVTLDIDDLKPNTEAGFWQFTLEMLYQTWGQFTFSYELYPSRRRKSVSLGTNFLKQNLPYPPRIKLLERFQKVSVSSVSERITLYSVMAYYHV